MGVGEDRLLEQRMGKHVLTEYIPSARIFYIYRWGFGGYHLSSEGVGTSGYPQADAWVKAHARTGRIELKPRWKQNYIEFLRKDLIE